jgi:hypothetical protein
MCSLCFVFVDFGLLLVVEVLLVFDDGALDDDGGDDDDDDNDGDGDAMGTRCGRECIPKRAVMMLARETVRSEES